MRYYFLILMISLFNYAFGNVERPLSDDEKASIKTFLHVLIEDSEAGYVLANKKPVCIHAHYFKDPFIVQSQTHKEAVTLKKGALIWKKLNKENSDIIIHICEKEDPQLLGYAHILVINIPLFHQVINENLSLFQYVLGPSVTSQYLLNALIHEDYPFHALLKYDKVLIGILLGFGTQNSLYGSRMENVMEASYQEEPPFLSANLIHQDFVQEYLPFAPSIGFKTLLEESDAYSNKIGVASPKLIKNNPNFIFGWLKEDPQNKKLIQDLENVQDQVQKLIHSENFEMQVLEKLVGKNYSLNSDEPVTVQINKHNVNRTIAKGIWESILEKDLEYFSYFIEGLIDPNLSSLKTERLAGHPNYMSDFLNAKENLQAANTYFLSLSQNKDFQCIEPNRLYYKTIKAAENDQTTCQGSLVTLTSSIYSPLGHCLSHHSYQVINLKNTIPGFAHGIKGMRIGETREILIHPSLAYDFETYSLDKCLYLKAIVTLEDIHNEIPLTEIKALDLDFLLDPAVLKLREDNYKDVFRVGGTVISAHLRQSKEIDVSQIKDYLNEFYHNQAKYIPTTQDEQNLINHIHWNIYWGT